MTFRERVAWWQSELDAIGLTPGKALRILVRAQTRIWRRRIVRPLQRLWQGQVWRPLHFHRWYLAHRYEGVYCRGCFRPAPIRMLGEGWRTGHVLIIGTAAITADAAPEGAVSATWGCPCGCARIERSDDRNLFFGLLFNGNDSPYVFTVRRVRV